MSTSPLSVDVFVTPIRPYAGDPPQGPGDDPTWAPMSSTLITGENEAILIDALMTNGQADALAEWAKSFRQAHHWHLHHPRALGPLARSRATSRTLSRGARLRNRGSSRPRRVGSRDEQDHPVLDVPVPGRTARGSRSA